MDLLPFWVETARTLERAEERLTGVAATGAKFALAVMARDEDMIEPGFRVKPRWKST